MRNFIRKFAYFISADFRSGKGFKETAPQVQQIQIASHCVGFCLALVFACVFYIDVHIFNASFLVNGIDFFGFDPRFKQHVIDGEILSYYFGATFLSAVGGFVCAVYFYCAAGHKIDRDDFYGFSFAYSILGNLIPFIVTLFLLALLAGIVWFGGVLLSIVFPAKLHLDMIPGFVVLQVLFIAKLQGMITAAICGGGLMLMPMELHPLRFKLFNSRH